MSGAPSASDPENRRGVFRTKSSTSSFRQSNKPNRVAQMSRRGGDQIDPHSMRGAPSREPRRGNLQRAKSMSAVRPVRSNSMDPTPAKPDRYEENDKRRKKEKFESDEEDSDLDSEDEAPQKPPRRKPSKTKTPPRSASSPLKTIKKTVNKRDMTDKRNRRKLHAVIFQAKMGVDMKDLFKQVQKGDTPRPPIKTLMMPSP